MSVGRAKGVNNVNRALTENTGRPCPRGSSIPRAVLRPGAHGVLIAGLLWAALGPFVQAERRRLAPSDPYRGYPRLVAGDGQRGYPVRIRATVTHFDENLVTTLIVHDGAFGQFVQPPPDERSPTSLCHFTTTGSSLKAGDVVEIEGHTIHGGFAPDVRPTHLRKLGQGPMPAARSLAFSEMLTGRYDCDFVEVEGVVQRAWLAGTERSKVMYADVAIQDGVVRAAFWDSAPEDVPRFIDARVKLRGNIGTIFGSTGQLRGVSLFAGRMRDMVVLEPAPDPFSLPERPIQKIYNYSSAGEVNRRIRVRGVVTAGVTGAPVAMADFTTSTHLPIRRQRAVCEGCDRRRAHRDRADPVRAARRRDRGGGLSGRVAREA